MKKIYLPVSAIALCIAVANSHAETEFKVYGKANLSLNSVEIESSSPVVDEWQLNSNASRLGVKGSYDINESLQAIYKMEYEVHIDDGQSSSSKGKDSFEQRNIYVGLRGNFGILIAGKHDTPLKMAQGKVDRFNDQVLGDIKNYMEGEDRVSNIVMYSSPSLNGLSASVAIIPGEDSTGSTGNDGLADGTSVSINYKNDWLSAAIARNDDVDLQDTTRVVAEFKLAKTKVGLLWQNAEKVGSSSDESSWLVSAAQPIGDEWLLKAQYGITDYSNDNEDSQMALGIDKKLGKNATLFAHYTQVERDQIVASFDDSSFAVGFQLKF